jgi:hypothetical protein
MSTSPEYRVHNRGKETAGALSFPRKRESMSKQAGEAVRWIPAYAGMTAGNSALGRTALILNAG